MAVLVKKSEKVRQIAMKKSKCWKKEIFQNHGTKKNGFPTQFTIKITVFWAKNFFQNCFKNHCWIFVILVVVQKWLILPAYEKVQILKKRNFLEPWDQKKWIPHSIFHQNHWVLGKKFFSKFKKKIGQNYDFFGQITHHHL